VIDKREGQTCFKSENGGGRFRVYKGKGKGGTVFGGGRMGTLSRDVRFNEDLKTKEFKTVSERGWQGRPDGGKRTYGSGKVKFRQGFNIRLRKGVFVGKTESKGVTQRGDTFKEISLRKVALLRKEGKKEGGMKARGMKGR